MTPAPKRRWFQWSLRTLFVVVMLAGLSIGGAIYVKHRLALVHNSFALWEVAGMINHYMITHDGAWPKAWDDLRGPYAAYHSYDFTFEDLQSRVAIDWNVDPRNLPKAGLTGDGPPFEAIRFRDGSHPESAVAPSQSILKYIQERQVDMASH